jgi:hypothetical protein
MEISKAGFALCTPPYEGGHAEARPDTCGSLRHDVGAAKDKSIFFPAPILKSRIYACRIL